MESVIVRYLSQEMILELDIKISDLIPVVEKILQEHGQEKIEVPPKIGVHPSENAFIHAMPGFIPEMNLSGMKWVSGFPNNHKHSYPQIMGLLIMNDIKTGKPLAIMDCRWITAVRTSVTTAVTAKYFARKDSETLGIIGGGVQGKFHALALKEVLPNLKEIKIYDISTSSMDQFQKEVEEKTGLKVEKKEHVEEVVRDSDVIVTATQKLEQPIISYDWLKEGVFGVGLEAGRAWGDSILKMDRLITDDWSQTRDFMNNGALPLGVEKMYTEIGKVVDNKKLARKNEKEKIIACNIGISAADIGIGGLVYNESIKNKIGIELPLMEKVDIL